jgi:two-component system NtrC family response regulator
MRMFNDEHRKRVRRFSQASVSFLRSYEWPGNVRELRNRVQRAIIMSDAVALEPADLGCEMELPDLSEEIQPVVTLKEARDRVEREMISKAIDQQNGSIVKAAEELGVSRPTLYDLMKKHNLMPLASTEKEPEMV